MSYWAHKLSKNKSIEIEWFILNKNVGHKIFEFILTWSIKQDHAGFNFLFSIFHLFYFSFMIYDIRHWDYENKTWKNHEDVV